MGNVFSICKCKNKKTISKERQNNQGEYKTVKIGDKMYILFETHQKSDFFEI